MGLTPRTRGFHVGTALLLVAAAALDITWVESDAHQRRARRILGADGGRIELDGGPAFRLGDRWVLMFECPGKVRPIRGAVVIEDDALVALHLFAPREGVGHDALDRPWPLGRQPARAPVEIAVVSGATISSQRMIDAVNRIIEQWRAAVR